MLLERLLRSLSPPEHEKLRRELALPTRSDKILERFRADSLTPTTSELCAEFGISKNNLYRLCSEIANECLRILANSGEFPKLEFYKKKFLAAEFTTELARTEKKVLQEGDADSCERFYRLAFIGLMGFPVSSIDLKLMRSYGMKWHRAKRNPPIDDELEIEMTLLFTRIGGLPTWKKMTVDMMRSTSRSLLDAVAARASVTPNPVARYYYYQAEWKATNYDKIIGEGRTKWIERSCEIVANHESSFPPGALDATEIQLAYERAMYCGDIQAGYERLKRSYTGQIPDTSRNAIFLFRYIRMCMLARQFQTARELLDVINSFPYTRMTNGIYQPYLLLRSALHILEGEIEQADRLNTLVRTINVDDDFFFSYEVEVRTFEVVCAYKRNDFELAELLITRDLKWLHSRKYSLSQSPLPYFYHTIKACIMYKMTGEKPRPSVRQHFEEFADSSRIDAMLIADDVDAMYSS